MGIYVYICVCVTLVVCNTGVHKPRCTGVCIERFSRGFRSGLVEKCSTALQFTAKYETILMEKKQLMQPTTKAGHVGKEAMK